MDINVSRPGELDNESGDSSVTIENKCISSTLNEDVDTNGSSSGQTDSHAIHILQEKSANHGTISQLASSPVEMDRSQPTFQKIHDDMDAAFLESDFDLTTPIIGDDEEDEEDEMEEGAEYDVRTGNTLSDSINNGSGDGFSDASAILQNMSHHGFDDIQFFPSSQHRSLRLQPQFQFHHDQFNDPNFHLGSNLSCFDPSGLVNLSGSGSVSSSFSLLGDSTSGDINSAFSESPFVFPDNVMEYGEPQFFPGNCVGYLETILEEDDEEYEEEEGCSGRHWWTADSDTDTDSVIRVDNNGQAQQPKSSGTGCQQGGTATGSALGMALPGEKDEVKPHFRSSASSKPFELEDIHLFDQLDHAFEETLREPKRHAGLVAAGHQSQSVEQSVESKEKVQNQTMTMPAAAPSTGQTLTGRSRCQNVSASSNDNNGNKIANSHQVFIDSTNNNEQNRDEMTGKGLKMLTQENVKAHSEENTNKIIYEVGEEKEQHGTKLGNAESRETFGSSLSPSSSDSEAPAEVAEEDFFYSSPGSEEEECRSQEETESEDSCSSDDSEKKGVVLAEFSLGSSGNGGGGSGGLSSSSGMMFGSSRSRRSFESPSRLKSFRSFDSLNCLAGTELLFSKPDTFPSIHHIKEVSEPSSESESSNEVSAADDRGIIPEEDEEEEEQQTKNSDACGTEPRRETQSLPSQHTNGSSVDFSGPSIHQINNKNSVSSSNSTVSSSTSGSGLRSTENLSEDSGIGNDGILSTAASTAASTPGTFIEESIEIMSSHGKQQNGDSIKTGSFTSPSSDLHTTSNPATNSDDTDSLPDSAKDYISRAEFALNPFVYSSLSSSDPDSSMCSAPSLTCNNNKMKIGNVESLQENGKADRVLNNAHISERQNIPPSKLNKAYEFVKDPGKSAEDKLGHPQRAVQNHSACNDGIGIKDVHALNEHNGTYCNGDHSEPTSSSSKASSPVSTLSSSKHDVVDDGDDATRSPDTSSLSESGGDSSHGPNFSRTNDTTCLESTTTVNSNHPPLNSLPPTPPTQTTFSSKPTEGDNLPSPTTACDGTESLVDGRPDKPELVNNNDNRSAEGHAKPIITRKNDPAVGIHTAITSSSSSAQFPVTAVSCASQHQPKMMASLADDELANTSMPTLSTEALNTECDMLGGIRNSSNVADCALRKQTSGAESEVDIPAQTQQKMTGGMTDDSLNQESITFKQNENDHEDDDDDIISSSSDTATTIKTSCLTSPSEPEPATAISQQGREMLKMTRKSFSLKSEDEANVKEESMKNLDSVVAQNPSSPARGLLAALGTSSKEDAEEGVAGKHATLQISSSLTPSDADNPSLSACPRDEQPDLCRSQEQNSSSSYSSSSSSGDEQNEGTPQPRFHRQRSDSESEYEAAESAIERNNEDMAYDIIVNSPSKKAKATTAIAATTSPPSLMSSVSGVVGATNVATSSSSSSSPFSAPSSSLALEQPKNMRSSSTSAAPAQYHPQSQNDMNNANKCNKKSGPVSTLSSLVNIHRNDMQSASNNNGSLCRGEQNYINTLRSENDKRLPVFESSIDDYDDDDEVADNAPAHVAAALPITENMRATSNTCNNNIVTGAPTTANITSSLLHAQNKYYSDCTTSHHHQHHHHLHHENDASVVVNGKQQERASLPLEQQQHEPQNHVIENTSFLLHHHHQLHNKHEHQCNNQQYENSDEITQAPVQSHFHVASSSGSSPSSGGAGEHSDFIVVQERSRKGKNFSGCAETHKQKHQQAHHHQHEHRNIIHQDQHNINVLRSVTLDDSTRADVAHNNLQLNQSQNPSTSHPGGVGVPSKSHTAPKSSDRKSHFTTTPTDTSLNQHHTNSCKTAHNHSQCATGPTTTIFGTNVDPNERGVLTKSSNNKGYHHQNTDGNKLVIAEPYYPNEIGVAEVKKFLATYVASQECAFFSGPLPPPPPIPSSAEHEGSSTYGNNHNKQNNNNTQPTEYYQSQSVKNPNLQSVSIIGSSSSGPSAPSTQLTTTTTGRERVILGDSNFGFFGCSSHPRSGSTAAPRRTGVHESHEPVVTASYTAPSSSDTFFPQVNLDLHSISAYGFPCNSNSSTLPSVVEDEHYIQDTWQEQQLRLPLKENNTFCPTSIDPSSASKGGSGSSNSIKRSGSPSSAKAAQEIPKDSGKAAGVIRRDQLPNKDNRQQQHLHLEDISLYGGIDNFSVPLGVIKAAAVVVAPALPSYIVGSNSPSNAPLTAITTAEKNSNKTRNSNAPSSVAQAGAEEVHKNKQSNSNPVGANGNLSTAFPTGPAPDSCTSGNNGINNSGTLPKGGEKSNDTHKGTHAYTTVPDILILKQFASCMPSDSETTEVEHKKLLGGSQNIKSELEKTTAPGGSRSSIRSSSASDGGVIISAAGNNHTKGDIDEGSTIIARRNNIDSPPSVEMLRSDSPAGSSAPSGIPLKTKTYGPRNEVEVVVVSSRTPSPAPGGFVSTSSSSSSACTSSRKLPSSSSSTSAGQERNEPALATASTSSQLQDQAATTSGAAVDLYERSTSRESSRSSSIPPPPSSPSPTSTTAPAATTTKANRSRVHFSPVVSEISWRESYIDQSSEYSGSTEDLPEKLVWSEDADGNLIVRGHHHHFGGRSGIDNNGHTSGGNNSASANLRKAGAAAAAAVVGGGSAYSGDNSGGSGNNNDGGSSCVRPLQVYDIQMSTRAESPPTSAISTRGSAPSGKGSILVEKVEMTSSPLHDREHEDSVVDRPLLLGESQSARKLLLDDHDDDDDNLDSDAERVTDLVDFRNNSSGANTGGNNANTGNCGSDQNNGTLGLYEDVEVQIEPTAKSHGSTTLSMVPDLLSQCENTNNTVTHIDVRIEESVPNLNKKNIVLNIGPSPTGKDNVTWQKKDPQHLPPLPQQKMRGKSQSPQPHEVSLPSSPEQRQIFPKMFAEDNKNDSKRHSSSALSSSSSKGKKSSKGFLIQGLSSSGKKSEKDGGPNGNGASGSGAAPPNANIYGEGKQEIGVVDSAKDNKKSSKPGFFERLSKIRLSSGSKNKKQKVHPKTDEIHQEGNSSGTPTVTNTVSANIGGAAGAIRPPLRSANSVNVNGTGATNNKGSNGSGGANHSSAQPTNYSSAGSVQPILKKSTVSGSTIPGNMGHYNGEDNMGILGDSENEPDEATQAFENILEEIAGLKSIQLRQEKSSNSSIDRSPTSQQVRSFAKRKQFYTNASSPSPPVSPPNSRSYSELDSKLTQFKEDTSRTLDAISKSHPDLEIIQDAVKQRQQSLSPEPTKDHELESIKRPAVSTLPKPSSSSSKSPSYAATEAAQNSEREWYRLLKSAAEKYSYHKGPRDEEHFFYNVENPALSHKTGIVETDLDTGASREMLDEDMLQLDSKVPCYTVSTSEIPTSGVASTSVSIATTAGSPSTSVKTRSLTNLSTRLPLSIAPSQFEESAGDLSDSEERAKSLEFLLDENHKSSSVPPENKLRLETRQLSEHELRIQRSLQRLNVPEWYKQHGTLTGTSSNTCADRNVQNKSATLSILKRSEYGSSGGLAGGWSGLSTYKAPSMSSLQSNGGRNAGTLLNKSNFVRGRPATMSVTARTSKESLLATGSASHSPSAFERSSFTYGMPFNMTRFGQGRLSTHSSSVSPPSTPDSTAITSSYVKKPYLGWRSQEKLNAAAGAPGGGNGPGAPKLSIYLPPAERLAADIMATRAKTSHPPVRPPVSDRPPLPRAPPRSEKTALTKNQVAIEDVTENPGAQSSRAMSKQTSSLAVVTKLPQQSNSIPPPEFFQVKSSEGSQAPSKSKSSKPSSDIHDSIRQVTTAISQYVNRTQDSQPQQKIKPRSGKKQAIWIESSFVGQKPQPN